MASGTRSDLRKYAENAVVAISENFYGQYIYLASKNVGEKTVV